MYYHLFDPEWQSLLPQLSFFKPQFYLAGGAGLALHLGHGKSQGLDFFTPKDWDTFHFFEELKQNLLGLELQKTQEAKSTLSVVVNRRVKLSFSAHPYPLLEPPVEEAHLRLASLVDIGCMKLSAIVSRALQKDYVDLYFILQRIPLKELLEKALQKFPELDTYLILKSLVFFEDVLEEPLVFLREAVDFGTVKQFLLSQVKQVGG